MKSLNGMAEEIHDRCIKAGWWDDYYSETNMATRAYFEATKVALVHSEVSEMLEGLRKGLPDSHLPHRSAAEVEMADVFIRLFDLAGALRFDLDGAVQEKLEYNRKRADHKIATRDAEGGKKY